MEELLDTVTCQPRARLCHVTPVYFEVNGLPFPTGEKQRRGQLSLERGRMAFLWYESQVYSLDVVEEAMNPC